MRIISARIKQSASLNNAEAKLKSCFGEKQKNVAYFDHVHVVHHLCCESSTLETPVYVKVVF